MVENPVVPGVIRDKSRIVARPAEGRIRGRRKDRILVIIVQERLPGRVCIRAQHIAGTSHDHMVGAPGALAAGPAGRKHIIPAIPLDDIGTFGIDRGDLHRLGAFPYGQAVRGEFHGPDAGSRPETPPEQVFLSPVLEIDGIDGVRDARIVEPHNHAVVLERAGRAVAYRHAARTPDMVTPVPHRIIQDIASVHAVHIRSPQSAAGAPGRCPASGESVPDELPVHEVRRTIDRQGRPAIPRGIGIEPSARIPVVDDAGVRAIGCDDGIGIGL